MSLFIKTLVIHLFLSANVILYYATKNFIRWLVHNEPIPWVMSACAEIEMTIVFGIACAYCLRKEIKSLLKR